MPFGGLRVVENSLESYGYELDPETRIYLIIRKTIMMSIDAYTDE